MEGRKPWRHEFLQRHSPVHLPKMPGVGGLVPATAYTPPRGTNVRAVDLGAHTHSHEKPSEETLHSATGIKGPARLSASIRCPLSSLAHAAAAAATTTTMKLVSISYSATFSSL
ncbi:hypothetical protein E2C01_044802 [Portunus trituberculatus]|uniref:Uncharacterized protein n=1 Tax=Portunus trituberculatus TaxID=210409 RepID=A0A5B7G056_PORTR|nr:hypothetical protein [Portunus trituberculatus]